MTTSIFRRAALGAFTIAAFTASLLAPAAPVAAQTDPFRDGPYEAPCTACPYDDAARDYVDSDLDGLLDLDEGAYGTDAFVSDTDSDGLLDGDEVNVYGTNPTKADTDEDGFSDGVEVQNGTDPHLWDDDELNDTDDDGLLDYDEGRYGASPYAWDSDGDTLGDGDEVYLHGTLPSSINTDGDGFWDNQEIDACTDPLDPASFPTTTRGHC